MSDDFTPVRFQNLGSAIDPRGDPERTAVIDLGTGPLVSAGGSGLVITSAALGLLLGICRSQTRTLPSEGVEEHADIGKPALAM